MKLKGQAHRKGGSVRCDAWGECFGFVPIHASRWPEVGPRVVQCPRAMPARAVLAHVAYAHSALTHSSIRGRDQLSARDSRSSSASFGRVTFNSGVRFISSSMLHTAFGLRAHARRAMPLFTSQCNM